MVGRPLFILSSPRATQVYRLLLLIANVRNDSLLWSDRGRGRGQRKRCRRLSPPKAASAIRSVGRSLDESVGSVSGSSQAATVVGSGSRLAQVVYEERNRSSRRQSGSVNHNHNHIRNISSGPARTQAKQSRAKRGQVSRTATHYYRSTTQSKAGK